MHMTYPFDAIRRDTSFRLKPRQIGRLDDLQTRLVDIFSRRSGRLDLAKELCELPESLVRVKVVGACNHMVIRRIVPWSKLMSLLAQRRDREHIPPMT